MCYLCGLLHIQEYFSNTATHPGFELLHAHTPCEIWGLLHTEPIPNINMTPKDILPLEWGFKLATFQCFRLASAIGHWPIKSENGLFLVNGPARMAYRSLETRTKWPIIFAVFRPRLVLVGVLESANLTTRQSCDRELIPGLFIGH